MFDVGKIALVIAAATIEYGISFFRMSNAIQLILHAVCQYEQADTMYRSFRDVSMIDTTMILESIVTQNVKRYFFRIGLVERLIEFCDQVNCHLSTATRDFLIADYVLSLYFTFFSTTQTPQHSQVNAHSCRNLHSSNFSFPLRTILSRS